RARERQVDVAGGLDALADIVGIPRGAHHDSGLGADAADVREELVDLGPTVAAAARGRGRTRRLLRGRGRRQQRGQPRRRRAPPERGHYLPSQEPAKYSAVPGCEAGKHCVSVFVPSSRVSTKTQGPRRRIRSSRPSPFQSPTRTWSIV